MTRTSVVTSILFAWAFAALLADDAAAFPQFQKQFMVRYIDKNDNKEYVELVKKKAKCFICHDTKKDEEGKRSKKNRNAYGMELSKLIGKDDKKNAKKILEALETVAKAKSNPDDANSPTFGELIAQGKLPAGRAEDLPGSDGDDGGDEE